MSPTEFYRPEFASGCGARADINASYARIALMLTTSEVACGAPAAKLPTPQREAQRWLAGHAVLQLSVPTPDCGGNAYDAAFIA